MAKKENQHPVTELISAYYNGNIRMLPPLRGDCDLPDALADVLHKANGILENMLHPQTGNPMDIGWIIYPYAMIRVESEAFTEKFRINGYVFADDGAGNPYYMRDNHVFYYDTIEKQEMMAAPSIAAFFRRDDSGSFSMDYGKIAAMLAQNEFPVEQGELSSAFAGTQFAPSLQQYLRMMKKPIRLHVSAHGSAATTFFSQARILELYKKEPYQPIFEKGFLLIGCAPNNDVLCIELRTGRIAYVEWKGLKEGKAEFAALCTVLPMPLEIFGEMVFTDRQYPYDAKTAREYLDTHSLR